ncbi:unnamed protein product [Cylindrotheca closterium]|uniref:acylphosphatase n=1 Tax=Cylindrotheca closterium TaxID=2856 RepID=A0AAD2CFJ8_9STRA|nr:unnamed protein product [Cylindrotheca closterium]
MRISSTIIEQHAALQKSKALVILAASITALGYFTLQDQNPITIYTTISLSELSRMSSPSPSSTHQNRFIHPTTDANKNDNSIHLSGFSYRVHGKVQGVSFRKYTQQKATELGLSGWIRNNKSNGTVEGQVLCCSNNNNSNSNNNDKCNQMKMWLQNEGSPLSEIEHAHFETIDDEHENDDQDLQALWKNLCGSSSSKQNSEPVFEIRKTVGKRK